MTASSKLRRRNACLSKASIYAVLAAVSFLTLAAQCFAQQSDTIHYEYDRLDRVTKITYDSSGASITYTYDAAGNRIVTLVQGTNLAPVLTSLSPTSVTAGTHGFTLVIIGNNLVNGATGSWNGSSRLTTYFGSSVTIDLTDADLATPGTFSAVVVNPAPGGAQSNALTFTVFPSTGGLQINIVTPAAGRAVGGQDIKLIGSFANLSAVMIGSTSASWRYTNGTGEVTVTLPPHAVGAVDINLVPTSGNPYSKSNAFAYLPSTFTDDSLAAGVTTAKAQHILELRQAVDALRAVAGLGPAPWTDSALPPFSISIKAIHILELRSYLEDAAGRLGYPSASYSDPGLSAGVSIKRVYIEELRQRIRNIAG